MSLMCPHHGARFDLLSGQSLSSLTARALATYTVRKVGDELEIDMSA